MKISNKQRVRAAMAMAGYWVPGNATVYDDVRKSGTRQLKVYDALNVFKSSRRQQLLLDRLLKLEFGDRYKGGYFVTAWHMGSSTGEDKSLCIELSY